MYTLNANTAREKMEIFTMLKNIDKEREKSTVIANHTLIWLSAESFRPVISKTFTHVVIGRPYFLDAEGWNKLYMLKQCFIKC